MKTKCPRINCPAATFTSPNLSFIVCYGSFYRKSDSRRIKRFVCQLCRNTFSSATTQSCYGQKKRRINEPLKKLLCSGVSQRRAAKILRVNPKTVVRHFRFLAHQARLQHEAWIIKNYSEKLLSAVQFDDLETSEHSKCKPLSVALAVDPIHRKILNFQVAQMPAKGHLSKRALKKYGYRKDQRASAWERMMQALTPVVAVNAVWSSDENPHYPGHLFRHFPQATHLAFKGARGCVTGQGELKKLNHDPLFILNHTCAMLRANLNRLFRKTWCTTKNQQGLIDHLSLFVSYFNQSLTPKNLVQSTG